MLDPLLLLDNAIIAVMRLKLRLRKSLHQHRRRWSIPSAPVPSGPTHAFTNTTTLELIKSSASGCSG